MFHAGLVHNGFEQTHCDTGSSSKTTAGFFHICFFCFRSFNRKNTQGQFGPGLIGNNKNPALQPNSSEDSKRKVKRFPSNIHVWAACSFSALSMKTQNDRQSGRHSGKQVGTKWEKNWKRKWKTNSNWETMWETKSGTKWDKNG